MNIRKNPETMASIMIVKRTYSVVSVGHLSIFVKKNQLFIKNIPDNQEILIHNVQRQLIYKSLANNNKAIDISQLNKGLYTVTIQNETETIVLKFVKK